MPRRHRPWLLVVLLLILGALAAGLWFFTTNNGQQPEDEISTEDWQEVRSNEAGFSYKYPAELGTVYISAQEWPPVVNLAGGKFVCDKASIKRLNGRKYCVTAQTEGAAGNIYTASSYVTEAAGGLLTVNVTIREVQCQNYDEPQSMACQVERDNFQLDSLIDNIVGTVQIDQ